MHNVFIKISVDPSPTEYYFNPRTCKMYHTLDKLTDDDGAYTNSKNRNRPVLHKSVFTDIKFYLGSACNYRCSYCRQWEHASLVHMSDVEIDKHIDTLTELINKHKKPSDVTIQWWGGEPLLYIDDIMRIFDKLPKGTKQQFTSNGSLMTMDIATWMLNNNTTFILSHDGPGQSARGTDPLTDRNVHNALLKLARNKQHRYQFMVSSILTKNNLDIYKLYKHHQQNFGDDIIMSKLELVIPYHDTAEMVASTTLSENNISDMLYEGMKKLDNEGLLMNIKSMEDDIKAFYHQYTDEEFCLDLCEIKCGIASESSICVDRSMNLYPCQVYPGKEDMIIGHVDTLSYTPIWTKLDLPRTMWNTPGCDCKNCMVVSLCRGICPYLDSEHITTSCKNKYAVYLAVFKYIFYKLGIPIIDMEQIEV